jgi:tetratricopeptide (TPR) repeat protein
VNRSQNAQRAKEFAQHALSLDPGLASAYFALGTIQFYYDWDFAAAERSFNAGLKLSPGDAAIQQRLATMLAAVGRLDEAIRLARQGRDLEPLLPIRSTQLAITYYYARDFANAEAAEKWALESSPGYAGAHFGLGRIYSAVGRQADAIRELELAVARSRTSPSLVELARVHAVAGNKERVREILAELGDRERKGEIYSLDNLAYIAAAEGRIDEAFEILNRAVDQKLTNVVWIAVDPRVDPLRKDPRFNQLLTRIGLQR